MNKKYTLRPEYADVGDPDYLQRWVSERRAAGRNIQTIATITREAGARPPARPAGWHYHVPDLIDGMLAETAARKISRKSLEVINTLQKKFEVFQQVVTGYDKNFRKHENAGEIDCDHYVSLARLLLDCYSRTGSATYLSTSLKVVDYILLTPRPEMREDSAGRFAKIIDDQLVAIDDLQKS
jgi:hypothetical protein